MSRPDFRLTRASGMLAQYMGETKNDVARLASQKSGAATHIRSGRFKEARELYAEICRANAISSDLVAKYVPQLTAKLFPG